MREDNKMKIPGKENQNFIVEGVLPEEFKTHGKVNALPEDMPESEIEDYNDRKGPFQNYPVRQLLTDHNQL